MSKFRSLIYWIIIGALLLSGCKPQVPATSLPGKSVTPAAAAASKPPSTATLEPAATPEPTRETDPALLAAMEKCANILPGQACLVEGPVQVKAQPESYLTPFREPGQTLNLADIHILKLGEAGSAKGLVVMRIQTEWPGGAFTAEAFGDVELVNAVPYGTRDFNPMQSLELVTGPNIEGQPPTSGFFCIFSRGWQPIYPVGQQRRAELWLNCPADQPAGRTDHSDRVGRGRTLAHR